MMHGCLHTIDTLHSCLGSLCLESEVLEPLMSPDVLHQTMTLQVVVVRMRPSFPVEVRLHDGESSGTV